MMICPYIVDTKTKVDRVTESVVITTFTNSPQECRESNCKAWSRVNGSCDYGKRGKAT